MEKFLRWLDAVGRQVGKGKIKIKVTDEKIVINEFEYEFENEIEKMFAKKLFGEEKTTRRKVKKNETKAED